MDTRQVIARFEAERQALAMMDHPNIAKVLDAGTTDSGRPYFVMELVKGVPITEYCDEQHLTLRERLELFVPVCQAVQHAHQKGIIHRDIKPTNVLVAEYDDRAGAQGDRLRRGQGDRPAADRADDVHRVRPGGRHAGVHEPRAGEAQPARHRHPQRHLFAGRAALRAARPARRRLTGSGCMRRRSTKCCGSSARRSRPSPARGSARSDTLPSVAANRQTEPAKLSKLVRGELDWIVMKALEKDRNRRYETASGLARDIERYLHDEPVLACPPTAAYRLRKFCERNKGPVRRSAVVLLALVGGIVGTTWGLVRAEQARRAEAERAEGERQAKDEAEAREAETRAVLDFVENKVFAAARPEGQEGGLGHDVTLRQAIEAALPFVDQSFTDQPLIEARLRYTLGKSFAYLGEAERAVEQVEVARTLYSKHRGPDHPDTLRA